MGRKHLNILILSIILLVTLTVCAYGNVYNQYYGQAAPISAETPKVILQQGIAGTSTIYTNSTSAKVSVSPILGFDYGNAFKTSNFRVSTASDTPVDDSEAILNIMLAVDSSVFVIYNAGNMHGSAEDYRGKGCAINVDGVDVAFSWQSPYDNNRANSVTVVYAANLTAGSHTIKGRFFANSAGATVGIDTRQIVAFWFSNVTAHYLRSTTASATTSGTPVDDPQATLTFTLSSDSVVFILYNVGNRHTTTEPARGKGITINVDGVDIATRQWQSPYSNNYANSVTMAYVCSLGAGSHTIKGRFFSNLAGSTTTINERQLMAFCFPTSLITYGFVQSATSVSTSSGVPVDDAQAVLNYALVEDSDSLILYVGGNSHGAVENFRGKGIQLQIDGVDEPGSVSWQSPYSNNYADSATSLWCEQLTAGSHTIKGRFFANSAGVTVTISHRQLLILSFHKPANYDYVLEVVNQVADAWKIRLSAYDQTNIESLSNCTIYFHDGSGVSRQIQVLNGWYAQQNGTWYDFAALSTVYIALTVSVSSAGFSYIHAYLEVLVPGTSTYNLMVITFEFS
jgi:hypothetical protein